MQIDENMLRAAAENLESARRDAGQTRIEVAAMWIALACVASGRLPSKEMIHKGLEMLALDENGSYFCKRVENRIEEFVGFAAELSTYK